MRNMRVVFLWASAILPFLVVAKTTKTSTDTDILMISMSSFIPNPYSKKDFLLRTLLSKQGNHLAPNKTRSLEAALLWYANHLHSLTHLAYFDLSSFEESKQLVGRGLEDIEHHLELLEPINLILWRRLKFAKRMFGAMVIAARELKLNNIFGSLYQQILALLLELNVTLFALYDSRGSLNLLISHYAKKMKCSRKNITFWADEFSKINRVSSSVRILFEYLNGQVKETFEDLRTQMSNYDKA